MTHELKFKLATGIFVIGALAPYVLWGANVYSGGFCSGFAFAWFMLAVADKASLEKPIGQIGFFCLQSRRFNSGLPKRWHTSLVREWKTWTRYLIKN